MICIHSRRDFRPNNVNGCWNGANEVKYAAINAGPRFYNAFSSHVQGKAGTASLKRTSETGKILSVAKCVIYRITRLSKLGSGSGATIETWRAWRSPRLPLSVDTLVDPPISTKLIPRLPFPEIQWLRPGSHVQLACCLYSPFNLLPLAWRQAKDQMCQQDSKDSVFSTSLPFAPLECGFWEFRFKSQTLTLAVQLFGLRLNGEGCHWYEWLLQSLSTHWTSVEIGWGNTLGGFK